MYDDEYTQIPRDAEHMWELARNNLELAKQVLLHPHFETEDEALTGIHRLRPDGSLAKVPMEVIRYRNISPGYDNREHFYEMGRALIPVVERHIELRALTPAFVQDWGKLMFCHGYIAAHFFDDSDDLSSRRGANKAARKKSKDKQRVWVARLLQRELKSGTKRKEAERRVAAYIKSVERRGGYPPDFPVSWFAEILQSNGDLKRTYGASQMSMATDIPSLAAMEISPLPPLEE
jgi:hypothetical protein